MEINEIEVTGKKFRQLMNEATKLWQKISFWTKSSDVEFDDGKNAETKVGAIDGITDSLVSTSSNIAASAKAVSTINNDLGGCSFEQEGEDFYIVGADAVRKKLGNNTLIGRISKNSSNSITFNCTSIPNYSKLKSEDFYITNITVLMHIYGGSSGAGNYTITPTVSYNQATGVLTVNNMFYGSKNYNYTCIYNAEVWAK